MRIASKILLISLLTAATAFCADDPKKPASKPTDRKANLSPTSTPTPVVNPERENEALSFVRLNHPELATVLEALKPMNPSEYHKAIGELSQVSRTLGDLKLRNPKRYDVALESWKAKSRVELIAAQLARSPSEELRSQLRLAIEDKVDVEIRRHRFELEQTEIAAKKAREALDLLENSRDSVVEARLRALQPKKMAKTKKTTPAKPAGTTDKSNQNVPAKPNGEDR